MKPILAFLLGATLLHAEPTPLDAPSPPEMGIPEIPANLPSDKRFFTYFGIGGSGLAIPFLPEASIGCRKLHSHHVWDVSGGGSPFGLLYDQVAYLYGQVSYLYFPVPSSGFYLGAGLTVGVTKNLNLLDPFFGSRRYHSAMPYVNLPISVGHQFANNNNYRFIQFQITPLLTTTISYGIGF